MSRKRDILNKYSKIINIVVKISKLIPKGVYLFVLKATKSADNTIIMFIRFICLKNCALSCGDNVAVYSNVYLKNIQNLNIGSNVSIQPMCYIEASGGIDIGNDVSIAHATTIMSEEHEYNNLNFNIKDQGILLKKTIIENNVWIGAGVKILAGSYIETGAVIAAGAVVKNKVEKNTVVGGIPAKKIKERK
ncbi:MAG: acyltransferase [Culicoidibacterales bacterium]